MDSIRKLFNFIKLKTTIYHTAPQAIPEVP